MLNAPSCASETAGAAISNPAARRESVLNGSSPFKRHDKGGKSPQRIVRDELPLLKPRRGQITRMNGGA
jgi:hypothetical protein